MSKYKFMKENLTIGLVQVNLIWENQKLKRKLIGAYIDEYLTKVDVFILPEMFTSGFTMSPKIISESMNGVTINWLKQLSNKK